MGYMAGGQIPTKFAICVCKSYSSFVSHPYYSIAQEKRLRRRFCPLHNNGILLRVYIKITKDLNYLSSGYFFSEIFALFVLLILTHYFSSVRGTWSIIQMERSVNRAGKKVWTIFPKCYYCDETFHKSLMKVYVQTVREVAIRKRAGLVTWTVMMQLFKCLPWKAASNSPPSALTSVSLAPTTTEEDDDEDENSVKTRQQLRKESRLPVLRRGLPSIINSNNKQLIIIIKL